MKISFLPNEPWFPPPSQAVTCEGAEPHQLLPGSVQLPQLSQAYAACMIADQYYPPAGGNDHGPVARPGGPDACSGGLPRSRLL